MKHQDVKRTQGADQNAGIRLARECAKLDAKEEKAMAEEGLRSNVTDWPDY